MLNRFNFANMVLDGVSRSITVNPQRCTRIKHKSSPCTACHLHCPADAIKVGGPGMTISVDWDKCTGCGICVNVCPTQAYTLRHNGYKNFIDNCCRAVKPDGTLNIACGKSDANQAEGLASIECIGILNAVDFLALYLRGARRINIKYGDCSECVSKNGYNILSKEMKVLKELAPIFEDLNELSVTNEQGTTTLLFPKQQPILRPVEEPKPNPVLNRRGIFSFFKDNVKETALMSASMMTVDKLEPRTLITFDVFLPQRRKMFIDLVMELGRLTTAEVATGRLFNNIEIAHDCVFCGMCAKFCGPAALKINEARTEITFNVSRCTSCLLCKPACYHGKLKYKDTLPLKDFFTDVMLAKKEESTTKK